MVADVIARASVPTLKLSIVSPVKRIVEIVVKLAYIKCFPF